MTVVAGILAAIGVTLLWSAWADEHPGRIVRRILDGWPT